MMLLYLTFLLPLAGYLILAFAMDRLPARWVALVGVGSVGLAAACVCGVGYEFLRAPPADGVYRLPLWTWLSLDNFTVSLQLQLDGLSLTMLAVVTGVGFLIHLFAAWYMREDEGFGRFFAYTNLFVASMLLLVLADDLLFLYLGWEGVGLCSYLLIGFYFREPANGAAAIKAFLVTRIGDVFMAVGLFILYQHLGALHIPTLLSRAAALNASAPGALALPALLLLGGAVGKSAQLPLQTWLADAMAGPTPVSALIHAATMVTAGVYLVARMHGLFLLAPEVLQLVAVVGALTLLLSGFAALVQTDIKRILAYSTMSQIGYMFLALGVGAWQGAIFHLMTHAFFKALLFLSAGSVILACHHEQNILRMGGLRHRLPLVYGCFLVGGGALSALPLVTAGFYSKDEILWQVLASGHLILLLAGLLGALLTSIYTFRLIFVVFHGQVKIKARPGQGVAHHLPLLVLLLLSTFIGGLIVPPLTGVLPASPGGDHGEGKALLEFLSAAIAIAGVAVAAWFYLGERNRILTLAGSTPGRWLGRLWLAAWGFDWLYERLFVRPYGGLVWLLGSDPFNRLLYLPAWLAQSGNRLLVFSQNGRLRWYMASMSFGALLVLALLVLV